MNRWKHWLPPLLVLWLFGTLLAGGRCLSLTLDEPIHIAVGYAVWARGKEAFWLLPPHGHPPLLNLLEAALFYLEKPSIPLEQLQGWGLKLTDYMPAFYPYLNPLERTEFVARTPTVWLTLLLGALLFRWGKALGGQRAGLITLFALSFDPILLAHGRLATTDVGTVALGTASLYMARHWLKAPSISASTLLGGLLGLTMLAKGSGVLWTTTVALLVLWKVFQDSEKRLLRLGQGLMIGAISMLVLWAGYGFTWGVVADLPGSYPAPAHWTGLLAQTGSAEERWVFALGLRKHGHWWWYFPLAFLLKNPLPLLFALVAGGIAMLRKPFLPVNELLALFLFPALYAITSITAGMNIGYRHLLPIHPLLYLLVGYSSTHWLRVAPPARARHSNWRTAGAALLGLWYICGTVAIFPYELAYFNELIGGPKNAHYYLVDSNLDWGQGYKALARYLEEHPGPTSMIAPRFTYIQPEDYGISSVPLPPADGALPLQSPFQPAPERYIISITTLQQGWPLDDEIYAWFRQVTPNAELAYTFFVYDVAGPQSEWVAQCETPAPPLSDALIAWGFGSNDLRQLPFDCTSAWVYPASGTKPGIYAFHHDVTPEQAPRFPAWLPITPQATDPFIARRLAGQRLSLDMRRYTDQHPAFTLYEHTQPIPLPISQAVIALPGVVIPSDTETNAISPLHFAGPLTFLGARAYPENDSLDVETWWQVTAGSVTRSLSIMGHLLNSTGAVMGEADGLGVAATLWQPGDIIVQRHHFANPPEQMELWLRTGVYWLDTMERWSLASNPDTDIVLLPLSAK